MTRVARTALPDGVFHVTARGVRRSAIFRDERDYAEFRDHLLRIAERAAWKIHAYCLLPNHYHLIVEATQQQLSAGMQRLNGRYAQVFNERYDRSGHVFESRFTSYVIESEEHYERALQYVRANPVEAGLCGRASEWPWSDGPHDSD
jgi:putative transposase